VSTRSSRRSVPAGSLRPSRISSSTRISAEASESMPRVSSFASAVTPDASTPQTWAIDSFNSSSIRFKACSLSGPSKASRI
jgi:hypothetical protein